MSSLAQILHQRGNWVGGSDRNFDQKKNRVFFNKLQKQGIFLFPQNETSISEDIDFMVVSSAIEKNNTETVKARSLNIPVIHRAGLLAELFNMSFGIGIAGTSGKSTVTGMVASILDAAGKDPTVINGGVIKHYVSGSIIGNAKKGSSDLLVSEVDESDGSITKFFPEIGVITNISKDHKETDELRDLFQTFSSNTSKHFIMNGDCPESGKIGLQNAVTFGLNKTNCFSAKKIESCGNETRFQVEETSFIINVPGTHNVYNALASIAVGRALDVPMETVKKGLVLFRGIKRRLDIVGQKNSIIVIDDFAHNPDKITASISTLKQMGKRVFVVFQPHGYGPTRFLLKELARAFNSALSLPDFLICLDIYDAGGTADRNISSMDLLSRVNVPGALYVKDRKEAVMAVKKRVQPGDVIAVMGARDDTLSDFAGKLFREITKTD